MSKKTPLVDFTPLAPSGDYEMGMNVLHRYAAELSANPSFDLGKFEVTGSSGIDALFARAPEMVTPRTRVRVASLQQLDGFIRLSADTLINKSDRDLWSIRKDAEGGMTIERMFDDNGTPLKG